MSTQTLIHAHIHVHARFICSVTLGGLLLGGTVMLGGCVVHPKRLTAEEIREAIDTDRERIFAEQAPTRSALSLNEAMARAVQYNLEHRTQLMQAALSEGNFKLARLDMLPILAANAGYRHRSNYNASSSRSLETGRQSLEPSTSEEINVPTGDITLTWNILDFGVSYFQAKQEADRLLISELTRRRVMLNLLQQVRTRYWQSAANQRIAEDFVRLTQQARTLRAQLEQVRSERLASPLNVLQDLRLLTETVQQLENLQQRMQVGNLELARLINLPPGQSLELALPEQAPEPPVIEADLPRLEQLALVNSTDLNEQMYNYRIAQLETRKALLRLLPGLELSYAGRYNGNEFLVNNTWAEAGGQVTWNLMNLVRARPSLRQAKTQKEFALARRMAVNMAVVTEVHLAWQRYENAVKRYRRAAQLSTIETDISRLTRQAEAADMGRAMDRLQEDVRSLRSRLAKYQAYAAVQDALGTLWVSLGLNPVPADYQTYELDELADRIGMLSLRWEQGELPDPEAILIQAWTPLADYRRLRHTDGAMVDLEIQGLFAAADLPVGPLRYAAAGLPMGLTLDPEGALITGRLAATASRGGANGDGVHQAVLSAMPMTAADTTAESAEHLAKVNLYWVVENVPPVAEDDWESTEQGRLVMHDAMTGVLANDKDTPPDDDELILDALLNEHGEVLPSELGTVVPGDRGGLFSLQADGSYRFNPNGEFKDLALGQERGTGLTYRLRDAQGAHATARLTVMVTGLNDPPALLDLPLDRDIPARRDAEGTPIEFALSDVFSDPDAGDRLTYSAEGLPAGLTLDAQTGLVSGRIAFDAVARHAKTAAEGDTNGRPADEPLGQHAVGLRVQDAAGAFASHTLIWRVYNPAPVALDDSDRTDSVTPIERPAAAGLLANDRDGESDADALTVTAFAAGPVGRTVIGDQGGRFTVHADGGYTFEPHDEFNDLTPGEERLTGVPYTISDGQGGQASARLEVTVFHHNRPPQVQTTLEPRRDPDGATLQLDIAALFVDPDPEDRLTYSAQDLPPGLTLDANTGQLDGRLDFTASQGGEAVDGRYPTRVMATDRAGATATTRLDWTVYNKAVVATADRASTNAVTPLHRKAGQGVLANDRDGSPDEDRLTVTAIMAGSVGQPVAGNNGGVFVLQADGAYRFDPGEDFTDLARDETRRTSIEYTVSDGQGSNAQARLTVTVTAAPQSERPETSETAETP